MMSVRANVADLMSDLDEAGTSLFPLSVTTTKIFEGLKGVFIERLSFCGNTRVIFW